MNKTIFILILAFFILSFVVFAADATIYLKTNQSEYYFLVNEQAKVPLQIITPYSESVQGTFSVTFTQKQNSQSVQYTNSQSKSQSISVASNSTVMLELGTSASPAEIDLEDVKLDYEYGGKQFQTTLPLIKVFFVNDPKEQKNQENQQQSQTKSEEDLKKEQQKQQEEQQKAAEEQAKQDALNQQRQQMLQNNQMNQDSDALKKSLEQQQEQQKQMEDQFKQNLQNNEQFKAEQDKLKQQGFSQTSEKYSADSKDSGNFEMQYKNNQGESLSLKGQMNNQSVQMNELSQKDLDNIQNQLSKDKDFQNFKKYLDANKFNQSDIKFQQGINSTQFQIMYNNTLGQNASISFNYQNQTIKDLKFKKAENRYNYLWLILFAVIIAVVVSYFILRKDKPLNEPISVEPVKEIDYKAESLKLLEQAKKLFSKGDGKEAYAKVSEAVRFFLSHKFSVKRELTIKESFEFSKQHNYKPTEIQKCLSLTRLVEFAKYQTNKEDFDEMVKYGKEIIN